ncbi:MAG: transglutaminase family protein [Promethearchaeota archaeon]
MKARSKIIFLYLFFFPLTNSTYSTTCLFSTISNTNPYLSSPAYGVSNYDIIQNVTYQVEINLTITKNTEPGDFYFKFPRLIDRMPNSPLTKYTPPYQDSELLYNNFTGYDAIIMEKNDKFNNTYDWLNTTLNPGEKFTMSQKYLVGLNEIKFSGITDAEIGEYDYSDIMFELYCNNTEQFYERDNALLIALSNSIVSPSDNPIEKASKICNWVANHIHYNNSMDGEKGALWAYNNLDGDCSEFSSLMVTLLRIQDIPARKVTGFLVSNNPSLRPKANDTWSFDATESTEAEIMGHAWMEYYVPDIGWIACDPTWHAIYNYFNRIDYLRFNLNVGANFFFPPSFTIGEFSSLVFYPTSEYFTYDYNITILVIDSNLAPLRPLPLLFMIFVGIGVAAVLFTIILLMSAKRKKEKY